MAPSDSEQQLLRLRLVEEHVALENRHDLDGIMTTFGGAARYDDEPWDAHYVGRDGVRAFLRICCAPCRTSRSTCSGAMPAKQRSFLKSSFAGATWVPGAACRRPAIEFPLCGIYTFDEENRLAGEKIYYDRATVLRRLGVFHEPDRVWGRINAVVMHPVTMAQILGRMIWRA